MLLKFKEEKFQLNLNRFISTPEIRFVKLLWIQENEEELENSDDFNNLENILLYYVYKKIKMIYTFHRYVQVTQKVYRRTPRIPLFYLETTD